MGELEDLYSLEEHLKAYIGVDAEKLGVLLKNGTDGLAENWKSWEKECSSNVEDYYKKFVDNHHLFDLANWHLTSSDDYIKKTCLLANDFAKGTVLDFGGGIGTHSISMALNPKVEAVHYLDINPNNIKFAQYRIDRLELGNKIKIIDESEIAEYIYDFITALDIVEHLDNPQSGIERFLKWLKPDGNLLMNYCFSKGDNNEYPFHCDDPVKVESFMKFLNDNFSEVPNSYSITAEIYKKKGTAG